MTIVFENYNILIISNKLSNVITTLIGYKETKKSKKPMGYAIFPCFIILRNLTHPLTKQWINHESIHLRQFIESLCLFWLYAKFEYIYARVILKYSHLDAYRYQAIEQEAYLNQHNPLFLKSRPIWNTVKYITNKTDFYTDENYNVIIRHE